MWGPTASLFVRWPQVHNKSKGAYRQIGKGGMRMHHPLTSLLVEAFRMNRIKSGPQNCFIKVLSASCAVWAATFWILIRRTCIILYENVLFHHFLGTNDAALAQLRGSRWASHLGIRTNTSPLRRWAVLTNGLQVNWSCKVTLPQAGGLPSDVGGCLTSPAWLLVSLSTPQTQAIFFFEHICKKMKKKKKKKSLMSLNSNCDHALHHIHRLCDVIVYATSHTVQNTISWELSCGPNCCSLSPRVPLQFDFFFYPLLKECHGCSANTKPWVCLRAYPSPSAHTIALFSLAHPLTACTVQAKKKHGNIRCRRAGAREAVCCAVWPPFLIGTLHVQSSDVQNKHGVRKAS